MTTIKVLLIATYAGCPRTWKMARTLAKAKFDAHILEWDRDVTLKRLEHVGNICVHRFRVRAPYGIELAYLFPIWWFYISIICFLNNFNIIQPQNLDCLIPIWFLKRIMKFKIVYDVADFYADAYIPSKATLLKKIVRHLELYLMKIADATIIVDECRITQIGFRPKNLCIIYNSPPDIYCKLLVSSKNELNRFTIFYAGGISENRGIYYLVETCQKIPDTSLVIAGIGLRRHFISFIKSKKNILFLGHIPYQQVLNWSIKCDCIVALYNPAILNMVYASPNKLFEAMMCGKPIIVSDGTAMAAKVRRHRCGLVVNFGNVDELKNAINRLRNDRNLAISLGRNGRNTYLEKYNWLQMEERLLKSYSLLSQPACTANINYL